MGDGTVQGAGVGGDVQWGLVLSRGCCPVVWWCPGGYCPVGVWVALSRGGAVGGGGAVQGCHAVQGCRAVQGVVLSSRVVLSKGMGFVVQGHGLSGGGGGCPQEVWCCPGGDDVHNRK